MAFLTTKGKVRISESLSKGEQEATAVRRKEVKEGLAKHGIQCDEDKIPNIAVSASGGGLRAMIALYGILAELKKCNLLDCIMYLCGASAPTWCMSALYKNEDWAEKIETLEKHQCKILTSPNWEFTKALNATREAVKDECYSLTDFWSHFVVYRILNELDESTLTEHRKSCEKGKNPYPIYSVVDKETYEGHHASSWFEFTPHEMGVPGVGKHPGIGAYIDTKHFGSIFEEGELVENRKEKTICYLQGLWGSTFANGKEIKKAVSGIMWDFLEQVRGILPFSYSTCLDDLEQNRLKTMLANQVQEEAQTVSFPWDDSIRNIENLRTLIEVYLYVLELQLLGLNDKMTAAEDVFHRLGNILQRYSNSKSYELFGKLHQTWLTTDTSTRQESFRQVWEALDRDFEDARTKVFHHEFASEETRKTEGGERFKFIPESVKFLYDLDEIVRKICSCFGNWTWGTTKNFLKNCCDVRVADLREKEIISLIDAGLAINSAYPLLLDPKRNVKLILAFEFGVNDPFLSLKKVSEYCQVRGIKFPEIDETKFDKDNPSNCYIFRTEDLTVMHFPLFNTNNCPGQIAKYRETYKIVKTNYSDKEIQDLLTLAKKNVAEVKNMILQEIKHIVSPPS